MSILLASFLFLEFSKLLNLEYWREKSHAKIIKCYQDIAAEGKKKALRWLTSTQAPAILSINALELGLNIFFK